MISQQQLATTRTGWLIFTFSDVDKKVIILTDGTATVDRQNTVMEANKTKANHIEIIAIGELHVDLLIFSTCKSYTGI